MDSAWAGTPVQPAPSRGEPDRASTPNRDRDSRPVWPPAVGASGGRPYRPEFGAGQASVSGHDGLVQPAAQPNRVVDEDAEPTSPLPVILPGATSLPRPAPVEAPRGPFEAARPARTASVTGSVEPPPPGPPLASAPPLGASSDAWRPGVRPSDTRARDNGSSHARQSADDPPSPTGASIRAMPGPAIAKLDQIKDLYLTAEAIGPEALDKHFEQVSQRQRELIKEFFDSSNHSSGSGS
jgi:hypothetical protein